MSATIDELIQRLRRNPNDKEAFQTLRNHYQRMGDYASLANLLEGWAAQSRDANAAASAYVEASQYAMQLNDHPRGVTLLERALQRNPNHEQASLQLENIIEQSGDFQRLVRLLQQRIQTATKHGGSASELAGLHFRLGEIWQHQFDRADRAVYQYRKAFELDPTMVAAVYAAREIYRNEGNWRMAATLCDQEVNAEQNPERKAALLRELAGIRQLHLGDQQGGIVALKQASELAPEDVTILYELASHLLGHAASNRNADAAELDRHQAADLLFRIAQSTVQQALAPNTSLDQPGAISQVDSEQALAYAQAALDANAGHAAALEMLEALANELGSYNELLPARWVSFLEAAPEDPLAQSTRQKLGHAYATAGQVEDAINCLEPLLQSSDTWAAEVLVGLYQQTNNAAGLERALNVLVQHLPPEQSLPYRRDLVQALATLERRSEAIEHARHVMEIDPTDAEILAFLEDEYQRMGAWNELRDLMLSAARLPGASAEAKEQRLRQAAKISESHLQDPAGAIGAWRAVVGLNPANEQASDALERLLREAERWDDLIQDLERRALALQDIDAQAEIFRKIARIYQEQKQNNPLAIESFAKVREFLPSDAEACVALSELLLGEGRYEEALPLLKERLETTETGETRLQLLHQIAEISDEKIGDDEGALNACLLILEDAPEYLGALERMELIYARRNQHDELLRVLNSQLELADESRKAELLIRMGNLAENELGDLDHASEYYRQAVELRPQDETTLNALCSVFEKLGQHNDLVKYLEKRVKLEKEDGAKIELLRRIARTYTEHLSDPEHAASTWESILKLNDDPEALLALREHSRSNEDYDKLVDIISRLEAIQSDAVVKRDLAFERAQVLHDHLNENERAIEALQQVIRNLDDSYVPVLDALQTWCAESDDNAGLAEALEAKLRLTEDVSSSIELCKQLADLYENDIPDSEKATRVLRAWVGREPSSLEAHTRLITHLDEATEAKDLVVSLDAVAQLQDDSEEALQARIRAANLCYEQLDDLNGAWTRLLPAVQSAEIDAATALEAIAKKAEKGMEFASIFVEMAQQAQSPEQSAEHWKSAARIYEELAKDPTEALEAFLRAFATDLNNESYLDEIDRLAQLAGAWERLGQVYETLLRNSEDDARKVELLQRHATVLETEKQDYSMAFDQLLRACALDSDDLSLVESAEKLATAAKRSEEMLAVYDRMRSGADSVEQSLPIMERAIELCLEQLNNKKRALAYLGQAALMAIGEDAASKQVQRLAADLDERFAKEAGADASSTERAARDTLLKVYEGLYTEQRTQTSVDMLIRAAKYLAEEGAQKERALEALKYAATVDPSDSNILDSLEDMARGFDMLEELVALLGELADEALEAETATSLFYRKGRLLEEDLKRPEEAAQAYQHMLLLRFDQDASKRLQQCLRATGDFSQLLIALGRDLDYAHSPEEKSGIHLQIASVWENDLRNKYEAIDALQSALLNTPHDEAIEKHLERLQENDEASQSESAWDEVLSDPSSADDPDVNKISNDELSSDRPAPLSNDEDDLLESETAENLLEAKDESAEQDIDSFDAMEKSDELPATDDDAADEENDSFNAMEKSDELSVTDGDLAGDDDLFDAEGFEEVDEEEALSAAQDDMAIVSEPPRFSSLPPPLPESGVSELEGDEEIPMDLQSEDEEEDGKQE
ncbi:MAG: hypothetical protein IPJ88_17535 [Myxococcales bacterium]|nr:MAG: hypothetical protein IPJ88_17535 [Myxococcales bacterium]